MNGRDDWKHALFVALGAAAVIGGSLLLASALDNNEGDDVFVRAFLAMVGSSLALFGIASAVASVTTFLVHRH